MAAIPIGVFIISDAGTALSRFTSTWTKCLS
jgi:hypothetical protein